MEDVEVVQLLAGAGEHHRLAGQVPHGQSCATACVAVEFGEHDAGEADTLLEGLGGDDGVLADHGVDDEQDLVGLHGVADVSGLRHELGVDAEPACGVDKDDVVLHPPRVLDRLAGHRDGIGGADAAAGRSLRSPSRRPRMRGEDVDAGLAPDDLQLLDGVGTLKVAGDQQRCMSLRLQPFRELAGEGRLAGALQPGQHHHGRRGLG